MQILNNDSFGSSPLIAVPLVAPAVTIQQILMIEPRIGRILERARIVRRPSWHTYEAYKRSLSAIVGWSATNPRLSSSAMYDVVLRELANVLEL